jgi:hypothetical protein
MIQRIDFPDLEVPIRVDAADEMIQDFKRKIAEKLI